LLLSTLYLFVLSFLKEHVLLFFNHARHINQIFFLHHPNYSLNQSIIFFKYSYYIFVLNLHIIYFILVFFLSFQYAFAPLFNEFHLLFYLFLAFSFLLQLIFFFILPLRFLTLHRFSFLSYPYALTFLSGSESLLMNGFYHLVPNKSNYYYSHLSLFHLKVNHMLI
jgi:hypothetical protein